MSSPAFVLIQQAIDQKKAISASYKGGQPRELCPHVLGESPASTNPNQSEETVLCYQFGGYSPMPLDTSHPSRKNWRCFNIKDLSNVTILNLPPGPWTPANYSRVRRQNNVVTIKKQRN